jgi:hypothetical protein
MREQHPRADHVGRRDFLAVGAAGLALVGAPRLAAGQAKRSGEIAAGLSERMLTLDPCQSLLDFHDLRPAPPLRPAHRRHE